VTVAIDRSVAAMADSPDPIALLRDLIRIDSVNPDLVPGAAGESGMAAWCGEWLTRHGFEVHWLEGRPGRPSVVGIRRGTGGGRSLLLNGHTDTVSVAGYDGDPFDPVERDGRLYGRGAFDMKSGLAAAMVAAARAASSPLAGDVMVACVADEEFGSIGTEEVVARFSADAAIVAEPTQLGVTVAHRGFAWFEVVLSGRAAHGSMPEQGIDTIAHATRVLAAIEALRTRLQAAPRHPLLGHSAVRVSMIRGGEDAATVAAECRLTLERRMLPGETVGSVEVELRRVLGELAAQDAELRWTLTRLVGRDAFEADPEWPIVATVMRQARRVLGTDPVVRGDPYWTDAGLTHGAGMQSLLVGVIGGGAHAATEWVDIASVYRLTDLLSGVIAEYCG